MLENIKRRIFAYILKVGRFIALLFDFFIRKLLKYCLVFNHHSYNYLETFWKTSLKKNKNVAYILKVAYMNLISIFMKTFH